MILIQSESYSRKIFLMLMERVLSLLSKKYCILPFQIFLISLNESQTPFALNHSLVLLPNMYMMEFICITHYVKENNYLERCVCRHPSFQTACDVNEHAIATFQKFLEGINHIPAHVACSIGK